MSWFCTHRCISPEIRQYKETDLELRLSFKSQSVLFSVSTSCLRKNASSQILCIAHYKWLNSKEFHTKGESPSLWNELTELSKQEPLLRTDWHYGCIEYTLEDELYTLLPSALFPSVVGNEIEEAIPILTQLYGEEKLQHKILNIADFKNKKFHARVLSLYSTHAQAITQLYPQAIYTGTPTRLLSALIYAANTQKRSDYHVLLHTCPPYFDLLLKSPDGLDLINRYPYQSYDNLLYYFLYALNLHRADLGRTVLFLCGTAREDHLLPQIENQVSAAFYLPYPNYLPTEMDPYCLCLPSL